MRVIKLITAIAIVILIAGCSSDPGKDLAIADFQAEFVTTTENGTTLGSVELTWDPEGNNKKVYNYNLYYWPEGDTTPKPLMTNVNDSSGGYTYKPGNGMKETTTLYFKAEALSLSGNLIGEEEISVDVEADVHPKAPVLSASNMMNKNGIVLSWQLYDHEDLTGLNLYRKTLADEDYTKLGGDYRYTSDDEHGDEDNIVDGETYLYYMVALYEDGSEAKSNIVEHKFEYTEYEPESTEVVAPVLNDFTLENNDGYLEITMDYDNENSPVVDIKAHITFKLNDVVYKSFYYDAPSSTSSEIYNNQLEDNTYDVELYLGAEYGSEEVPSNTLTKEDFTVDITIDGDDLF